MSEIKTRLVFNRFLACEQAPEWGIVQRQKSNIPYRSPLVLLANFSFRPIPHLGACSPRVIGFRNTGPKHHGVPTGGLI